MIDQIHTFTSDALHSFANMVRMSVLQKLRHDGVLSDEQFDLMINQYVIIVGKRTNWFPWFKNKDELNLYIRMVKLSAPEKDE